MILFNSVFISVIIEFIIIAVLFYPYVFLSKSIMDNFKLNYTPIFVALNTIIFLFINYYINYYLRCKFSSIHILKYKQKKGITDQNITNSQKLYIKKWKQKIKKEAHIGSIVVITIVSPFLFIAMFSATRT